MTMIRQNGVIRWRTIEWWGAGAALFLQSGAILPLMMVGPDGGLDEGARSKLQLLSLPVYAITIALLAPHPRKLLVAAQRSLFLTLLLFLPFVSTLWSVYPSITLRRAVALLFSVLLAYLLAIRFTPRQLLLLLALVLGPCILLSLAAAVIMPHLAWMEDPSGLRGIFIHKNVMGWYGGVAVLIFSAMSIDGSLAPRWLTVPAAAAALLCLAASESMTPVLSGIGALGFAWFFARLQRLHGLGRVTLIIIVLQIIALVLVGFGELFLPLLEALGKDATLTGRVPLWALVDQEIARRFLLGFGYQAFWTEANGAAWRIWQTVGWPAPNAHNGFRETFLNFGVVGFALLVVTIARSVWHGGSLLCSKPEEGWLWLNVFVGMFLVTNLTESLFLIQNNLLFIIFATALIMFSLRAPELRRHGRVTLLSTGEPRRN